MTRSFRIKNADAVGNGAEKSNRNGLKEQGGARPRLEVYKVI
jgi:hypothetical protein